MTLLGPGEIANVEIADLVPGIPAKIKLNIHNKCGRLVKFEKISVSCGCMFVDNVKSELPLDGNVEIPITLKADFSGEDSSRTLTLVESAESRWVIVLYCKFVTPIKLDKSKVIDLDSVKTISKFEIPAEVPASMLQLVGDARKIECEALGSIVMRPAFIKRDENFFFTFECENAGEKVQRSSFSESVRLKGSSFAVNVKLDLRSTSAIRVMPERCDFVRLREGLLRICVSGESLNRYQAIDLVGYDSRNEVIPLSVSSAATVGRLKIYVPTCSPELISTLDRIEVFGRVEEASDRVKIGSVTIIGG